MAMTLREAQRAAHLAMIGLGVACSEPTLGSSSGSGSGASGGLPGDVVTASASGDTTIDTRDEKSFLKPAANVSIERLGTYQAGLALFDVAWIVSGEIDRDGLGPTYVGTSCRSCHFRGGRGAPPPPGQPMTSMLVRLSVPSADGKSFVADPRWKANVPDLARQTAGAFLGDMGITSPLHPTDNCPPIQTDCVKASGATPDIDAARFEALVFLSHLVAVPFRPDAADPEVLLGKALFSRAGCVGCHAPSFVTGSLDGHPEVEGQRIYPYTDLLVHDMGAELADDRPDAEAGGRDFRTAPLWGVGSRVPRAPIHRMQFMRATPS